MPFYDEPSILKPRSRLLASNRLTLHVPGQQGLLSIAYSYVSHSWFVHWCLTLKLLPSTLHSTLHVHMTQTLALW